MPLNELAIAALKSSDYFEIGEDADQMLRHIMTVRNSVVANMVLFSGAEFALLRSVTDEGGVTTPITVTRRDIVCGLRHWDCLEGGGCLTADQSTSTPPMARDILLFTGDLQKWHMENVTDRHAFDDVNQVAYRIEQIGREVSMWAPLLGDVNHHRYFALRAFLLIAKTAVRSMDNAEAAVDVSKAAAKRAMAAIISSPER